MRLEQWTGPESFWEDFQTIPGRFLPHGREELDYTAPDSLHSGVSRTAYGPAQRRHCVRLSGGGSLSAEFPAGLPTGRRYWLKINCMLEQWRKQYNDVRIRLNGRLLYGQEREFIENICQGWPSLYYEIGPELLSAGTNRVELSTRDSSGAGLLVSELSLVSLPQWHDYEQVSCRRAVRRGGRFAVAVAVPNCTEPPTVETDAPYCYEGCRIQNGFALLRFTACSEGRGSARVHFPGASKDTALIMPDVAAGSADHCLVGMDSDDHRHDRSSEAERVLEVFALTGMGDFVQFRPCTGRTHLDFAPREDWKRRIALLMDFGIQIGIADTRSHLMPFVPELAGASYVGCHIHEPYLYFCLPLEQTKNKAEFQVDSAAVLASESFGESEALYRGVLRKTREKNAAQSGLSSVGSPSLLCVYEAAEGFDRVTLEPVSNLNLLTAAGRGSTPKDKMWGAHVPLDWYFGSPNNDCKTRKLRLALQYLYLSGARYLYTENDLFKTNAFSREDWESPFCAANRAVMRNFYEYVIRHPREGVLRVNKAVLYGRHEHFYWYHDDRMAELPDMGDWDRKVWGKWEDDGYRKSWRALDAWLPAAANQVDHEAPENLKLFSGTPYGSVDVISWEKELSGYDTVALLGWNTMCGELLERLMEYVAAGGRLYLSCCHLNVTDRNDRPFEWIVHDRLEEFLGLRLEAATAYAGAVLFTDGTLTGGEGDPLRLAGAKRSTAQVLAKTKDGRPVVCQNKYGKGSVILGMFADYPSEPWALAVSRKVMELLGEAGGVICDNPDIAFTERVQADGSRVVDVLNMNCAAENGRERFCLTMAGHTLRGEAAEGEIATYRLNPGSGRKGMGIDMEMGKYEKVRFPDAREIVASFGVRAVQVGVPNADNIDEFERFIDELLAPNGVNVLLLCLDYGFEFKRHPEIVDEPCTTWEIAGRLARASRRNSMTIVPVINVLAHQTTIYQGWQNKGMLRAYPDMEEFFEGEYHSSKCVCSRHPRLRPIVYDMIDELTEAFETKIIHTGFDEVWDIGKCPRCKGVEGFRLFAEYINDLNRYIKRKGGRMWIWSDQLVDGRLVPSCNPGYETCLTDLYRAVDLVDRDVVMCDWHYYDEPYGQLSPSYWAMRGFEFIPCVFNSPKGAEQLLYATRVVRSEKTLGTMLTTWCRLERFMAEVHALLPSYRATGELPNFRKEDEDSGIDKAQFFSQQAAAMFIKLYVSR